MNNLNAYLQQRKEYSKLLKKKKDKSKDNADLEYETSNHSKYERNPLKTKRLWSAKVHSIRSKRVRLL